MKPKSNNLFGLIAPFLIALVFTGGYFIYWNILCQKVTSAISDLQTKGFNSSKTQFSGFPYRISAKIIDANFSFGNSRLNSEELLLSASPFSPYLWVLEGAKNVQFNGKPIEFAGFQASLRLNSKENIPKIRRLSIVADKIALEQNPIISGLNAHLILDDTNNNFAFSFEGDGLEKILAPQNDFKIQILRGLLSDANLFEKDFAKWKQNGAFEIKYGKISILEHGIIKGGELDRIIGKLVFIENDGITGELRGDLKLTLPANQNLERKDFEISVRNSKIDFVKTLEKLIE